MIVNLSATYIGQCVLFSYKTPLRGLQSITSLSDVLIGQTVGRFFNKEFRYTMDGARYSDWATLSLGALQAIEGGTLPLKNDFILEFRYTRAGATDTGIITIQSLTIGGVYSMQYLQVVDFVNTVFEDIGFTDEYWNKVWINLLDKLYKRGIVPKYIVRGDENEDDRDYIDFWKTTAYFFALTIALVDNKISKLIDNQEDLSQYLLERGVFVNKTDSILALQLIAAEIFDQIRRRGTKAISFEDGGFIVPNPDPVHGELLRLVNYDIVNDEFLFDYIRHNGWYVDVYSPGYFGLSKSIQLNKSADDYEDIITLSNYVTTGSVSLIADGFKASVAQVINSSSITTLPIKIDDNISYEFTFFFKYNASDASALKFSLVTSDSFGNIIQTNRISNGAIDGTWVNGYTPPSTSEYYFFRGIIHKRTEPLQSVFSDYATNLGVGQALRLRAGAQRAEFKIENNGIGYAFIWDIKIRPLNQQKSNVFLDGTDITRCWIRNRNYELAFDNVIPHNNVTLGDLLNIKIRQNLLPMGSALIKQEL